jgi:hypothetical protein
MKKGKSEKTKVVYREEKETLFIRPAKISVSSADPDIVTFLNAFRLF